MVKNQDMYVLAVVAVVAIVAIIAMAQNAATPAAEPQTNFVPVESARTTSLSDAPTRSSVPQHLLTYEGDHDYNGNGEIDSQDVARLADAVADQKCPYKKDCDVNNDRTLDERDIALVQAMVDPAPSPTANVVRSEPPRPAQKSGPSREERAAAGFI